MTLRALTASLGLAGGIAASLLLAGCASGASDASPTPMPAAQTWTSEENPEVFLSLGDDARVAGKDGCNRLIGTWSSGGEGTVDLGDLASTMMYCEGVDTWLSKAATLRIDGSTAVVLDLDGAQIGTLTLSS